KECDSHMVFILKWLDKIIEEMENTQLEGPTDAVEAANFFEDLSKDLLHVFEDENDYDIIIQAGNESDFTDFKAHSLILRARSRYFKSALSDRWAKNKENIYCFQKPNISPALINYGSIWLKNNFVMVMSAVFKTQSFKEIQNYIITLDPPIDSDSDVLAILNIADEFALREFIDRIQRLLIRNQPSWLKTNLVNFLFNVVNLKRCEKFQDSIIEIINQKELSWLKENIFVYLWDIVNFKKCKKLQDYIFKTICVDPEPLLFELENFPRLEKEIFLEFIKRDDLVIEEIDVWDYLVNWGKAQLTSVRCEISLPRRRFVSTNVASWGKNEFSLFKKTIGPLINYIRFCEMSRAEFYHHVMPYEKAFPEDLYKELVAYFMADIRPQLVRLQPRVEMISIDSTIINRKNAWTIVKWIKEIDAFTKKPSYKFILNYRASRNGFGYNDGFDYIEIIDKFNDHKQGMLAVLIKIKDSDRIIGGYHNYYKINVNGFLSIKRNNGFFYFENRTNSKFHSEKREIVMNRWLIKDYKKLDHQSDKSLSGSILFDNTNITAGEIEIFEIRD
ncbi:14171_t:CDS:2, partial [Racocetra persica]